MSATVPDDLTARVAVLEHIARDTRDALGRIEQRFDKTDARLDRTDDRIDANFRWLFTLGPGGFAALLTLGLGLLGVIAHGFKWI